MENLQIIDEAKSFIGFDKDLKPEQKECLLSAFEGRDVLAILPTGFGKSLIFQLAPFAICLKRDGSLENIRCFVLVITPLNSIMIDQCHTLSKLGIKACAIDYNCINAETYLNVSDSESDDDADSGELLSTVSLEDIVKGGYQVVYAHPEALVQTKRGDRLLSKLAHDNRLVCVAIDEAHMILEW